MDTKDMRIAMAQISSTDDLAVNRAIITEYVQRSADAGADLVVFPECAMHRWTTLPKPAVECAEPLDGPFVSHVQGLAATYGVAIFAGMSERVEGNSTHAYNAVVAVDALGNLAGVYRKIHLFDAFGFRESDTLLPGDGDLLVVPVRDQKVGVAICYDLRFPEMARALIDAGATTIVYPSAWVSGPLKELHWEALLQARAIENVCWVVGVSQAELRHIGRSITIDPMGVVLSALDETPGLGFADIDMARLDQARKQNPSLDNRRM